MPRVIDYDSIPAPHMRAGVERWIEEGRCSNDSFLWALVTNDLGLTVGKADDINSKLLLEWVRWFYWEAPSGSHGSVEKAEKWKGHDGLAGIDRASREAVPPAGPTASYTACERCGLRPCECDKWDGE